MFRRFYKLVHENRNTESGSAMIFAIMVLMLMLLSVTLVTSSSVTDAKNTTSLQYRELMKQSAIAGIQNALLVANNSLPSDYAGFASEFDKYRCTTPDLHTSAAKNQCFGNFATTTLGTQTNLAPTPSNVAVGKLTATGLSTSVNVYWRWFTQKLAFTGGQSGYYVYAVGYSTTAGVTDRVVLQAEFTALTVDAATYQYSDQAQTTGIPVYRLDTISPWQYGLTGVNNVTIAGKLYSAESTLTTDPSTSTDWSESSVATSGTITFTASDTGPRGVSYATAGDLATCGSICDSRSSVARGYALQYNLNLGAAGSPCPNAASTYPAVWNSSSGFPTLAALNGNSSFGNVYCVQTANFNGNQELPATYDTSDPLQIYVFGSTSISNGVQINKNGRPTALQLFTQGVITQPTNANASANIHMLAASSAGTCTVGQGIWFGALNCTSITIGANAKMYFDATASTLNPSANGITIWSSRYYYELT